jgi:hypothetical protein
MVKSVVVCKNFCFAFVKCFVRLLLEVKYELGVTNETVVVFSSVKPGTLFLLGLLIKLRVVEKYWFLVNDLKYCKTQYRFE